jgi:hypothetical protein
MNGYTIRLSASWNKDRGSYQYRTQISFEHKNVRDARTVAMTFNDENSFRQRVNPTLSRGQDVENIFSRLHEGQIATLGKRMLTDEQAAGFGWTFEAC